MHNIEVSPVQQKILDYIEQYVEICGYPPSIAEIGEYTGISTFFGVRKHLDSLIRKGLLEKDRREVRNGN